MRSLTKCLFYSAAALLASGMVACSDDDESPKVVADVKPVEGAVTATTASFTLDTKGVESVGYVLYASEEVDAEEPDGAALYNIAAENGDVMTVTADTAAITVCGMEANREYTVYFVFKIGDEYRVMTETVTSGAYDRIINVISTDMFSMKIHIEVPDTVCFQLSYTERTNYEDMKAFGQDDLSYAYNFGYQNAPIFKGPQTITIEHGKDLYEGALNAEEMQMWGGYPASVLPGTGYVILISQCTEEGSTLEYTTIEDNGGGGGWMPWSALPILKGYTETVKPSNGITFNGIFAKQYLFSAMPKVGEGSVEVTVDKVTEKNWTATLTPSDDMINYVIFMTTAGLYENMVEIVGGEEGIQAACLYYGDVCTGEQTITYPVNKEEGPYKLMIVGCYNENGTVQSFHVIDNIMPIESTLPVAELAIAPVVSDDPYHVSFNIKAPNKDCHSFKYLLNYTGEWFKQLNSMQMEREEAIQAMMDSYGVYVDDAEVMSAINSEEGYTITFGSVDEMESWLIVESFNPDEKGALYAADTQRATSGRVAAEEPVAGFEAAEGEWTMSFTEYSQYDPENPVEHKYNVEVFGSFAHESMTQEQIDAVLPYYTGLGYSEEEATAILAGYAKEYNDYADDFSKRYAEQNMLALAGFKYGYYYTSYSSPWDLFNSTTFSAYSTDEFFRAYGPKIMLKKYIDAEGKPAMKTVCTKYAEDGSYASYVESIANWLGTNTESFFGGYVMGEYTVYTDCEFPVELSEDGQTLTIMPLERDGVTYYPCIYFASMYFSGFDLQISSPIVLTKGHTPGLDDANKAMMAGERNNAGHVARRTKILKPREVKQGKVTSLQAEISNRRK